MKCRRFLCAAAIAALLLLLCCCTADGIPREYAFLKGYTIIVRDNTTDSVTLRAAKALAQRLEAMTGVTLPIKTDAEDEENVRTDKEIVIGDTNRMDEFAFLPRVAEDGFVIAGSGDKLLAYGTDEAAVDDAVAYLITMYLTPENPAVLPIKQDKAIFGVQDGECFIGDPYTRFGVDMTALDGYLAEAEVIDASKCGIDTTGTIDATELMQYIHATGKKVYYPNGTYLFNGMSLELSGGIELESREGVLIRNSISDMSIIRYDAFGNLMGLMQNHLEYKNGGVETKNGSLLAPPLSKADYDVPIDFLPFFYNDFGLDRTLSGQYGWDGWFYWSWNHHDSGSVEGNDPYDPARHPSLGFYYGDDPVVLDWQCYWLRQYGVDQMILLGVPDPNTWSDPRDGNHWIYQLFHNAKNFREMNYVLGASYSTDYPELEASWYSLIDFYAAYPSYYTHEIDGNTCAVIYNWDFNTFLQGVGGDKVLKKFMQKMDEYAEEKLGVDGIAVMARTNKVLKDDTHQYLNDLGCYVLQAGYEPTAINGEMPLVTYADYVNAFNGDLAKDREVIAISTGLHTHTPHPSKWPTAGTSPALFEEWAAKAVKYISENDRLTKCCTIYNIAEWAEGGPSLQPNVQDGFGYLEAVAHALGIDPYAA